MVYIIIILAIFVIEIFVKDYIEKHQAYCKETKFFGGKISLTKQYNTGACMNLLEKKPEVVKKVTLCMIVAVILTFLWYLPKKGEHVMKLALSFLLGGALSNLCDRLYKGHVVDYMIINVKKLRKVVFNFADICIFVGSIMVIMHSLFHKGK